MMTLITCAEIEVIGKYSVFINIYRENCKQGPPVGTESNNMSGNPVD